MFCNKCGKELPDGAAFCSGCGNQIGTAAAPQASAAPAQQKGLPPILQKFLGQVIAFFTKKDQIAVVAGSAKDKTWSGAIVMVLGILMYALATMVNVNQTVLGVIKSIAGGGLGSLVTSQVSSYLPSGATFGYSLLTSAVVAIASVIAVFVVAKYLCKKELSLAGSLNIVAYASLPMVAVYIVNLLLGLIWYVLPMVTSVVAIIATLILIYSALNKVCGFEKPAFLPYVLIVTVIVIVAGIFLGITVKGVGEALLSKLGGLLELLG